MKKVFSILLHPLHAVKWWHLILVILIFAPLSLFALRSNSQTMGELKLEVVEADKSGEGTEEALRELRAYVFNHMNTSTEVELAETYARAVARAQEKAALESGNQDLYIQAEAQCNRAGVPGVTRAQCVQDYINERFENGQNPQPVELPNASLYKFEFVAPKWSPDLAGISIAIVFTSFLLVGGKFIHRAFS